MLEGIHLAIHQKKKLYKAQASDVDSIIFLSSSKTV